MHSLKNDTLSLSPALIEV